MKAPQVKELYPLFPHKKGAPTTFPSNRSPLRGHAKRSGSSAPFIRKPLLTYLGQNIWRFYGWQVQKRLFIFLLFVLYNSLSYIQYHYRFLLIVVKDKVAPAL
jgi:hypothetical protein